MAVSKRKSNRAVKNPVKRHSAYPDQKALHPSETNFVQRTLQPFQEFCIQVNGRSILNILKRVKHPESGFMWAEALADIEIIYDNNMDNAFIRNMNPNCVLTIRFKVI